MVRSRPKGGTELVGPSASAPTASWIWGGYLIHLFSNFETLLPHVFTSIIGWFGEQEEHCKIEIFISARVVTSVHQPFSWSFFGQVKIEACYS
jgi:hypothetical protein